MRVYAINYAPLPLSPSVRACVRVRVYISALTCMILIQIYAFTVKVHSMSTKVINCPYYKLLKVLLGLYMYQLNADGGTGST